MSKALVYSIKRFVEIIEEECEHEYHTLEAKDTLTGEEIKKLNFAHGGMANLHRVSCLLTIIYQDLGGEE